jgi:ubiquinone/menaquinone biosynthesis C-methylase UbiE
MVHHKACPLCFSEKIDRQFICTDHFVSKKEFPIFKCSDCNFLFTQDYPDETEIARYYESENYISHSDTSEGFSNKLYRAARSLMLTKKKGLIRKYTRLDSGNILDIGCGTGHFLNTMKKAGWVSKGIEINEKARNFAISNFGLEVSTSDSISAIAENSFDCITLWHVLEHFHDPFSYLTEIYRILKPGAICIIALPNSNSFDANHYKRYWAAWDVPRHLWHFNPVTFCLFSEKSGLILQELRILPLDVFYISQMSERYKASSLPFLKGVSKAFIFSLFTVFQKKRSSSVVYILRKP